MLLAFDTQALQPNKHISPPTYQYLAHQPTKHDLQFINMITTRLVLGDITRFFHLGSNFFIILPDREITIGSPFSLMHKEV